jgi:hypothetical protein
VGIEENQFPMIWRAISKWLGKRNTSPYHLARVTGYTTKDIERGIAGLPVWITSDFVHDCVEFLGITNARTRSIEDSADFLPDEVCVDLLLSILQSNQ